MKGFALIEVLVALLIISGGLLAVVGMQLSALRYSEEAYQHSIAITQLASMADRLRVNHGLLARESELQSWNKVNARLLAKAQGNYYCSSNVCKITLDWEFSGHHSISLSMHMAE